VAGSTATGFVAWLRETGGRSNELRNLSESIASLKNDIATQQDRQQADLRAIQERQQADLQAIQDRQQADLRAIQDTQQADLRAMQDRQQTTNDNLYNLQVVSVGTAAIAIGTAATATVIAVFRGRG
jgi:predicted  nucleic acid-binding Zn-ribbon protein